MVVRERRCQGGGDETTETIANGDELYPDVTKNQNNDRDSDETKREVPNKTMVV